jgi:hypothetical protein
LDGKAVYAYPVQVLWNLLKAEEAGKKGRISASCLRVVNS